MPMTRARTRKPATMPRASLDSSLVSGSAGTRGAGASRSRPGGGARAPPAARAGLGAVSGDSSETLSTARRARPPIRPPTEPRAGDRARHRRPRRRPRLRRRCSSSPSGRRQRRRRPPRRPPRSRRPGRPRRSDAGGTGRGGGGGAEGRGEGDDAGRLEPRVLVLPGVLGLGVEVVPAREVDRGLVPPGRRRAAARGWPPRPRRRLRLVDGLGLVRLRPPRARSTADGSSTSAAGRRPRRARRASRGAAAPPRGPRGGRRPGARATGRPGGRSRRGSWGPGRR